MSVLSTLLPILKPVIIGGGVAATFAAIRFFTARSQPATLDQTETAGRIAMSRPLIVGFSLLCLGIAGVALYAAFFAPPPDCACKSAASWAVPAVLGGFFLLVALLMLTSLSGGWEVCWDEDGIEGPTSVLPPPFGPRRKRVFWEHLDAAGQDSNGWFVQARSGRRIRWNFFYSGYPALMLRIEEECPWLFDDPGPPPPPAATAGTPPHLPSQLRTPG